MKSPKNPSSGNDAEILVKAWQRAQPELEANRLRELRQLSEQESAQRFAHLLCLVKPYPLRESSGLVEQQRIFSRLRDGQ